MTVIRSALALSVLLLLLVLGAAPAGAAQVRGPLAATAADPAGGPRWGVRVYGNALGNRCLQAGQLVRGRLVRVFADGRRQALTAGALTRCSPPRLREGALLVERTVDDPRAETPRLNRLVVAGVAGDRALRATLSWRGGRRVVRTGRWGAYLAVLPRRARQRDLTISVRHSDGKVTSVDFRGETPRWRSLPGSVRVELETGDPVSGRRQGLLVWRIPRGMTCFAVGDLVDGEVGAFRPLFGTFAEYPVNTGGNCADRSKLDRPVAPGVSTDGRTMRVTGVVRADVATVEVAVAHGPLQPVRISRSGVYALVLPATGPPEELPPVRTRATLRDGTVVEETFGGSRPPGA